ncbi:MAG: c-type cytochrome, partial [Polaribacter sp.]
MKSVTLRRRPTSSLLKSTLLLLFLAFSLSSYSQDVDVARQKRGKTLFKTLCSACHKLDKKLVGPPLGKIEDSKENTWLLAWIKNNAEFRASGDADAIAIFEEYNEATMSNFPQLTDDNINDILYYTTVGEIKKAPVAAVTGTVGAVEKGAPPQWLIYLLAAAIIVAFLMIASLLRQVNELKGNRNPSVSSNFKRDVQEFWIGVKNNTFLKVLATIFCLLIGAYLVFGSLFQIGVDQGYQPIQPIAFSHKIHAGDNKINCQYCHTAAKHSRHSGIPPVNICMNCHKNISEVAEETVVKLDDGV